MSSATSSAGDKHSLIRKLCSTWAEAAHCLGRLLPAASRGSGVSTRAGKGIWGVFAGGALAKGR